MSEPIVDIHSRIPLPTREQMKRVAGLGAISLCYDCEIWLEKMAFYPNDILRSATAVSEYADLTGCGTSSPFVEASSKVRAERERRWQHECELAEAEGRDPYTGMANFANMPVLRHLLQGASSDQREIIGHEVTMIDFADIALDSVSDVPGLSFVRDLVAKAIPANTRPSVDFLMATQLAGRLYASCVERAYNRCIEHRFRRALPEFNNVVLAHRLFNLTIHVSHDDNCFLHSAEVADYFVDDDGRDYKPPKNKRQ